MSEAKQCVSPETIKETDYLAYLNDEGRPEFVAHLQSCAYCQNEIEDYHRSDILLRHNFRFIVAGERMFCSAPHKLGEYLLRSLDNLEEKRVVAHLQSCPLCRQEVLSLQNWLPEPEFEATPGNASKWLRRVIGKVMPPGSGLRGSPDGTPQIFQIEDVQLSLTVQPTAANKPDLIVEGLLQREYWELEQLQGLEIRLLTDGAIIACATIDDIGNFIFENIKPSRHFTLEINLTDKIVTILDIKGD